MSGYHSIESIRNADAIRDAERHQLDLADAERIAFLRALDGAKVHVTEWEAQFIKGFIDEPKPFSPRQREVVDKLRTEYGHHIPGSSVASPHLRALDLPSVPGQCDYLVRGDDRRQHRCGQPATITLRAGLQLCAAHESERQAGIERLRQFKERQLRS